MTGYVERLDTSDITAAATVLGTAFAGLEIARWLVPESRAERERCLREQFTLLIRAALAGQGWVDGLGSNGQLTAVAVWFIQSGDVPLPPPAGYDTDLQAITGAHVDRFRALDEAFAHCTPREPHVHLALLGAVPQAAGFGGRLLKHRLAELDQRPDRPLVALTAGSRRAAELYLRHGFHALEPESLPGSDLSIYPMLRDNAAP